MRSELTRECLEHFRNLPERVKDTAKKNDRLWTHNPCHPGLEFKKPQVPMPVHLVRVGIGWRALGVMKGPDTIVWFWVGLHSEYDAILKGF